MNWIIDNEQAFRLTAFFGSLTLFGLIEILKPRRKSQPLKGYRWINNFSLIVINAFLLRVLIPGAAVYSGTLALQNHWGIFHFFNLPTEINILLSVLILDLCIYWQHRLFHRIPLLWRLHRVHHIDPEIDISSSARFHSIEILLSMLIKMSLVLALGVHPAGVILFEVLLNTASNFNHANMALSEKWDRWIKKLIVTPDMHRIHHSQTPKQTDSNFSFFLSIWDRIFNSYSEVTYTENDAIQLGLKEYLEKSDNRLDQMLINPFQNSRSQMPKR